MKVDRIERCSDERDDVICMEEEGKELELDEVDGCYSEGHCRAVTRSTAERESCLV